MQVQRFDPYSTVVTDDPYPIYRVLRESAPAYYDEEHEFWLISRFADVQSALRDWSTFSSAGEGVDIDQTGELVWGHGNILDMDPPRHDELRKLVQGSFTPKAIRGLEVEIRRKTDALINEFAERGTADLAKQFAYPLALANGTFGMLGFPESDRQMIGELMRDVVDRHVGDPRLPQKALDAAYKLRDYMEETVEDRRRRPREDLISQMVGAQRSEALRSDELLGLCFILFAASVDTTASVIGTSLLNLEQHPHQRKMLVDDLALIPSAVEELVRYDSPAQFNARTVTRTVELHGEIIPKGARVLVMFGSANRDERQFFDPDRLDVKRKIKRHLGFGEGIHHCIGAPLARLELKVALELLLPRIGEYEVVGPIERLTKQDLRGITSLPVSF